MATSSALFVLVTVAVLAACDATSDSGQHDSAEASSFPSAKSKVNANEQQDPTSLPYVAGPNGTRYPYFEYGSSSLVGEDALAVFVYPIFSNREKGLALPHMRGQDAKELFESDELLGRQFSVVASAQTLKIDKIPVSRPIDLNADSRWSMIYADEAFQCRVVSRTGIDFSIKCSSESTELNLKFNSKRGFTSYQDFCREQLCTYVLESTVGLLSPYHLEAILPERKVPK